MKNLKDILKTKNEFAEGYFIENNIIESVNVNTIAHFGNVTSFEILCRNIMPYSCINNIGNLGYVIKAFIELFDLEREDGIRLSEIKNVPCRLVFKGNNSWGSRAVAIGNFMKDKFVFIEDLAKLGLD